MATSFRLPLRSSQETGLKTHILGWIKGFFARRTQITIEKIESPSGAIAWRGYDPRTGRSRYAETMGELISWLES